MRRLQEDRPDLLGGGASSPRTPSRTGVRTQWSVLVPFFNERAFIVATIESLAAQTVPVRIVLIDNASTDDGAALAISACRRLGVDWTLVEERRAGKVWALATGLAHVATPYVATCDADTLYPADYLAQAQSVLERPGTVVAGAVFVAPDACDDTRARAGAKICATARVLRGQCHTGGAGQAFRTEVLRRAGGFDAARWGYVLEDHEIIHRVLKYGRMGYAPTLWCAPSPRERDRASIRWTLVERLTYAALAPVAGDWFFYRFLARRLAARRLGSVAIRERQFQDCQFQDFRGGTGLEGMTGAAAYPVCG